MHRWRTATWKDVVMCTYVVVRAGQKNIHSAAQGWILPMDNFTWSNFRGKSLESVKDKESDAKEAKKPLRSCKLSITQMSLVSMLLLGKKLILWLVVCLKICKLINRLMAPRKPHGRIRGIKEGRMDSHLGLPLSTRVDPVLGPSAEAAEPRVQVWHGPKMPLFIRRD